MSDSPTESRRPTTRGSTAPGNQNHTKAASGLEVIVHLGYAYADGHLEFLGYFEYGECIRSLELDGKGAGRGTNYRGSGGSADWVNYYADGTRESFDAWSDNGRPHPYPYKAWVKEWIKWIEELDRYQGGHGNLPY